MQVFISNKEIIEIAEGLVRHLSGGSPPKMVDIDGIARCLDLTIVYESQAENDQNKIAFLSDGICPLAVYRNGLIRQSFLRETHFTKLTQDAVAFVMQLLNNRLRKCLNWETPAEVISS